MPFARRDEPISPRTWARLSAPRPGWSVDDEGTVPLEGAEGSEAEEAEGWAEEEEAESDSEEAQEARPPDVAPERRKPQERRERIKIEVPSTMRSGRWVPPRRAVVGMFVVAALVAGILGVRVAWAMASDDRQATGTSANAANSAAGSGSAGARSSAPNGTDGVQRGPGGQRASPSAGPSGASGAGDAGGSAGANAGANGQVGVVVVHVVGAVAKAGLVTLPAGSRVADAIAAAGGATPEADLAAINVARLLVDGEQIRVPLPGEIIAPGAATGGAGGAGTSGTGSGGSSGGAGQGRLVSLNSADVAALDSLPGVGPVLAQRILDWRTTHGRFTSVDELGEVSGIGEKLLSQLKPLVTL